MSEDNLNIKAAKAGLWYTIGNFLIKGCVFLSLPLFTRLLSVSELGIYDTYLAYEAILTAIFGLGMYGTIKNAKLKYNESFDSYFSSIVSLSFILFVVCLICLNVFCNWFVSITNFTGLELNILICQSFGSSLIQMFGCKLNIEFRYKPFLIVSAFNTLCNIGVSILLILFVFPNQRYFGRILGTAFPIFIISFYIMFVAFQKGKKLYSRSFWKYALLLGLPLLPHVLSQSLLGQFDRIMITNIVSEEKTGIYGFFYSISSILAILGFSLDNAWTPWVYMKLKSNKKTEIKKIARDYIFLFSLLTIGFMCVTPEFSIIIGGNEYIEGLLLLIPLSIANYFVFIYYLPVNVEYYNNKTIFISIGTVGAALINYILNYIFIPVFGYMAAAFTTLASHMLLFFLHYLISTKYKIHTIYDMKTVLLDMALVLAVGTFLVLFGQFNIISGILRIIICFFIVLYVILNRKKYLNLLKEN